MHVYSNFSKCVHMTLFGMAIKIIIHDNFKLAEEVAKKYVQTKQL